MYSNIYFIGIGGIGMSAIARYYNAKGFRVSGYDKTPIPMKYILLYISFIYQILHCCSEHHILL